jgi:hypothetical protein
MQSPDGKFAPGRVHIEVFGEGAAEIRDGQGYPFPFAIYSFSQADLKAAKAR